MQSIFASKTNLDCPRDGYPYPQFRRNSFICLNGKWEFAIDKSESKKEGFVDSIVVPFAPETELSGINRRIEKGEYLHYRKDFSLPEGFVREKTILHFEAVDQVADVYFNGEKVAHHEGGYLPFSADVTHLLKEVNEILVDVYDDPDSDVYPRGKQVRENRGIWYTPTSGIWGSVWMESVPTTYIKRLVIEPNLDEKVLVLQILSENCKDFADVTIEFKGKHICSNKVEANKKIAIPIDEHHPWSPESPDLYDLRIRLGEDEITSYFAMRKFSIIERKGNKVFALNNKPYFLHGVLDQGYWPESGLTPPNEEAVIADIQGMKDLGFNMIRKHIKVEPMDFYYHCDRLGIIVIQDILNAGSKYSQFLINTSPFIRWKFDDTKSFKNFGRGSEESREFFRKELPEYVKLLFNAPCIGVWTLFNEGWGQFNSVELTEKLREYDPTRPIDSTSGWFDQGAGDFYSRHIYFKAPKAKSDKKRALALSEFGGYVFGVEGHRSGGGKGIHYNRSKTREDLNLTIKKVYEKTIAPMIEQEGLSFAVLTQLSDVEEEKNGIYTFDRAVCKFDRDLCLELAKKLRFKDDD